MIFSIFAAWLVCGGTVFAAGDSRTIVLDTKDAKVESHRAYFDAGTRHCVRDWKDTNTIVRWKFDVPAKGAYRVLLTYACPQNIAGSEIEVSVGPQHANATTQSTGDWDTFKEFDLGPVLLRKPGPCELSVKATRAAGINVFDLRTVKLVKDD